MSLSNWGSQTFDCLVESTVLGHVVNLDELKPVLAILLLKQVGIPSMLHRVSDSCSNVVSIMEELVRDVRAQEAIGSRHKNEGTFGKSWILQWRHFEGV